MDLFGHASLMADAVTLGIGKIERTVNSLRNIDLFLSCYSLLSFSTS